MADIAMCLNSSCTDKDNCYRFKDTPNKFRQTYSGYKQTNGICKGYWPIDSESQFKRAEAQQNE